MEVWQHADFGSALLDAVDALVVVVDHHGAVRLFNGACERTSGFTEEEVLGRPFKQFLTDSDHDAAWATFQAFVETGSPSSYENQWRTKSGTFRIIAWSAAKLTQRDGSMAVLATGIDLTERRDAERDAARTRDELEQRVAASTAALRESESRFRRLADDLPTGVCVTRSEGGQVLYANAAFHRMFGTTAETLPRSRELYWDETGRAGLLAAIRAQGGVKHHAVWLRRADGAQVAVELSATEIEFDGEPAVLAVGYEATERLASAEALRSRAALIDAICDSVITFDLSGRVTSWNACAERLYGWSAEEALGRPVDFLWRNEECARASISEVISRRQVELVRPSLTKSGEVVDVALTLTLARAPGGTPTCIVGQSWDYAGRQTLKDALGRSIDERLCEAQAFAARVVAEAEAERQRIARELHDGALQSISAAALQLELALQQQGPPSMEAAVRAGRAATRTAIEDLRRACSDLRPDLLESLGLPGALSALAEEHRDRTGAQVELDAGQLPQLAPDGEIVVFRLVQEALRNIELHARAQHVVVRLRHSDGTLSVDVEDDGRGFDAVTSRGQGLRGMRERIAAVGGYFETRSLPGQGTRLTARIPYLRS